MNRQENVLVIGNGFDLYHFLPTRYIDFLKVVNRLIELESMGKLSNCQYIKYILGPDSPIYQQDDYIKNVMRFILKKCKVLNLIKTKFKNWLQFQGAIYG